MLSADIFVAEYGDWGWRGCVSVMGVSNAVPYTSDVDVTKIRVLSKSRAAYKIFNVPFIFTSTYDSAAR